MAKTLNTVNVVEIADTTKMSIDQVVSFPDTKQGNQDAEDLFVKLVREYCDDDYDREEPPTDEELNGYVEDGYYENGCSYIAIVHSSK